MEVPFNRDHSMKNINSDQKLVDASLGMVLAVCISHLGTSVPGNFHPVLNSLGGGVCVKNNPGYFHHEECEV